jgi:hypothetical protein
VLISRALVGRESAVRIGNSSAFIELTASIVSGRWVSSKQQQRTRSERRHPSGTQLRFLR